MLTTVRNDRLTDTLHESFTLHEADGHWYPVEPGIPLVRVYEGGNAYLIERRRDSQSAWLPIVTAEAAEFDPAAFRAWRSTYPVVETG